MKNYDFVGSYHGGFARVELHGKCGFIDENGNEICPIKYDWAGSFHNGFAIVKLDGKYGFINSRGEQICPIKYDWVEHFQNGFAEVELNGQVFKIDTNGNEIKQVKMKCKWKMETDNLDLEFYETACGEVFHIIDGTLKNNNIKFCPFCGNEIKVRLFGCTNSKFKRS